MHFLLICLATATADDNLPVTPAVQRVDVATADVATLLATLERLQLAEAAILKQLEGIKGQAIMERNEELTDSHSIAIRGPSAQILFDGPSQGKDQSFIFITDRAAAEIPADQQVPMKAELEAALRRADASLNSCFTPGWPIVTFSFSLDGGRVSAEPELRELAPNSAANSQMANCVTTGITNFDWPDFGHDVIVSITWRNVGGL